MDDVQSTIGRLYARSGFLERYGSSLVLTVLIVMVFLVAIAYFALLTKIAPVKANWVQERCNPEYIPFAGIIQGKSGMDSLDFTAQNFAGCTNTVLRSVANDALAPINYVSSAVTGMFSQIEAAMGAMRGIFSRIRQSTVGISGQVMDRTLNTMAPLLRVMAIAKDTMAKSSGVATTGIYTLLGSYMTLKALIGSILQLVIIILISLAAMIIIMWIIPFTWPVAASMTAIFIAIAIPLAIVAVFMAQILATRPSGGIPPTPSCFAADTQISLRGGTMAPISSVVPGQALSDGQTICSIMKLCRGDEVLYSLGDTVVSGTHLVFDECEGWISVENHPQSLALPERTDEHLYCLTTSNKVLRVGDHLFCDWDDLTAVESERIGESCGHLVDGGVWDDTFVHSHLESGFAGDAIVHKLDGTRVPLKEICPGDRLEGGHVVLGVVVADGEDVLGVNRYFVGNNEFVGGPNFRLYDDDLGVVHSGELQSEPATCTRLFHLVTDTHRVPLHGLVFSDYDSRLDAYAETVSLAVTGVCKNYL